MCAPFAKAIREAIPNAEIVLDRFHIIKLLDKRLWSLNKKTFNNLEEKDRKRFSEIRYLLSKNRKQLLKWEKRQIKDYLRLNKEMKCIYKENNARQEGINNKIKMMKRRGYGYRNWLNFEFRIYGECNP